MPFIESHSPGSFCWMELGTTDQSAAKRFYTSLLQWSATDFPMGPNETYTMFQSGEADSAAAYRLLPDMVAHGIPPHWNLYISVKSADETAKLASKAGGKVMAEPFDVYDMGRMAILADPTGATFSIWEPKRHHGVGVISEENAFCWADLSTPEPGRAREFYERVFGWTFAGGEESESEYLQIQNGREYIGGIPPADQRDPYQPAHWLIYFQSVDCDGSVEKAKQAGASVMVPPMSLPNTGRVAVLADPQGAVFALYEPQSAA